MHLNFAPDVTNDGAAVEKLRGAAAGTFITWQSTGTKVHLSYLSPSDVSVVHLRMAWDVSPQGAITVGVATDTARNRHGSMEELVQSRLYLKPEVQVPGTLPAVPALQPLTAEEAGGVSEEGGGMRQRIRPSAPPDLSNVVRRGINPATGRYEVVRPSQSLGARLRSLVSPRGILVGAAAVGVVGLWLWVGATLAAHADITHVEVASLRAQAEAVAVDRVDALRATLSGVLGDPHHAPDACETAVQQWALDTAHAVQPLQGEFMEGETQHKLHVLASGLFLGWVGILAMVFVGSGRAAPEDLADAEEAAGRSADSADVARLAKAEPWSVKTTAKVWWGALVAGYAVVILCAYVGQGLLWDLGGVSSSFDDRFYKWHSHHGWWGATGSGKNDPGPDSPLTPVALAHMLDLPTSAVTPACVRAVDAGTEEYTDQVPHILMLPLPGAVGVWAQAAATASFGLVNAWILPPGVPAHTTPGHLTGDLDGTAAHAALDSLRFVLPNLTYAARSSVCFIPALFVTVIMASYTRQGVLELLKQGRGSAPRKQQ